MNIIETERLILRSWQEEDAEIFAKINQDPRVIEFLRGSMSLDEAKAFILGANQHIATYGFGLWAATLKKNNALMGFIGLNIPDFNTAFTPCVEVGARLAYEYWRKGYALEGANAVLKVGFENFDLQEIVGFTSKVNYRSIAGMEKLGMKRDLNGDFDHPKLSSDHKLLKHLLYRISRKEFYSK